jgi:Recombination endonuclease VII
MVYRDKQDADAGTTRVCKKCGARKEIDEYFRVGNKNAEGVRPYRSRICKPCFTKRSNEWHILDKYGLTKEDLDRLLEGQGYSCAICLEPFADTPHVDHDHFCCPTSKTCGKCIRGLLCDSCNKGLGSFRDSSDRLRFAARYLDDYERVTGKKLA